MRSTDTASRIRRGVADLRPGYAAVVMATGVLSSGLRMFDRPVLSWVLLALAAVALVVLLIAYLWGAVAYPHRLLADLREPREAFGFFTLVAAPNVLAIRVSLDDHLVISAVLGLVSVPIWLVLTYAVPGALVVGPRREPVLPGANGSWFMWVVGTQSLASVAATLGQAMPGTTAVLAPLAVALWSVGVVLYLMLLSLVTVHLLEESVTPHALGPTYWVYMGATAITVLAAARILMLPTDLPIVHATRPVVAGIGFLLWAFGTWWIPLLLVFALWRHSFHQEEAAYDPSLWSVVFPLGMYGVATVSYGKVFGLGFMVEIARVEVWLGFAAWLAVTVVMVRAWFALWRPAAANGSSGPV